MKEEKQTALEAAFTQALFKNMEQAESFGITDKRLRANCEKYGAVSAVKEVLRKIGKSDTFSQLAERHKANLTVEAVVTDSRFGALFEDEEVNACFMSLCETGFFH